MTQLTQCHCQKCTARRHLGQRICEVIDEVILAQPGIYDDAHVVTGALCDVTTICLENIPDAQSRMIIEREVLANLFGSTVKN